MTAGLVGSHDRPGMMIVTRLSVVVFRLHEAHLRVSEMGMRGQGHSALHTSYLLACLVDGLINEQKGHIAGLGKAGADKTPIRSF